MGFLKKKNIYYEINYLSHKFKLDKLVLVVFTLLGSLIVSLGDAQAFFTGENSPIPQSWTFLKKPLNSRIFAISSIVTPTILILLSQNATSKEEVDIITKLIERVSLPLFEGDLNQLHQEIIREFAMTDNTRIYILTPIRKKFCHWRFQVVAKSKNLDRQESSIMLDLDEGHIGYVFTELINEDSKNRAEFISSEGLSSLPPNCRHLNRNNKKLIRKDNKGYLIIPIFERSFINSLFIIDTNKNSDLRSLNNKGMHEKIFQWIGNDPIILTLIWRIKNNGS